MKKIIKIILILVILIIGIYSLKNISYAKYNITKELLAIKINIDRTPPIIAHKYKKDGNKIELTIYSDEEIKPVEGWELGENKKNLKRVFIEEVNIPIIIEDLYGNKIGYHYVARLKDIPD